VRATGLIEVALVDGVAFGRVLDEFDAGVAGVHVGEVSARPLDTDARREGLAADGEPSQHVQMQDIAVEGDGPVEVGNGDGEVVCGWVHTWRHSAR
jgi:hypothetical protein